MHECCFVINKFVNFKYILIKGDLLPNVILPVCVKSFYNLFSDSVCFFIKFMYDLDKADLLPRMIFIVCDRSLFCSVLFAYIYASVIVCAHAVHVCVCVCVCVCVYMYVYVHVCACIHVCTHYTASILYFII